MKTLIQIFTIVAMSALPVWLSGCGGGNADPHAGHNHGAHGDEAAPETVTLSDEMMAKYKITTGSVKLQILRRRVWRLMPKRWRTWARWWRAAWTG